MCEICLIAVPAGRKFVGTDLGRKRILQDKAGHERMRDRGLRPGGVGEDGREPSGAVRQQKQLRQQLHQQLSKRRAVE